MVKIKTLRPVQQSTENRDLGFLKPIRIETSPATAFPVRPVANYGGEGAGNSVLTGVLYVVARCGFVFSARPSWTTVAQRPRRIHHVGEAADTITQAAAGQMMREKLFVIPCLMLHLLAKLQGIQHNFVEHTQAVLDVAA